MPAREGIEIAVRQHFQPGRLAADRTLDFGVLAGEPLVNDIITIHNYYV
nr:MAG TPA: hypothetical protein [Caudoviricetes sp.]DAW76783.1 MAG TPA: hypothetical protein [Caudoviricetes sp.]